MTTLNISSLKTIVYTDTLKVHNDLHSIVQLLVDKIKEIPNFGDLHMNVDLIVWVCLAIDQILTDSKLKDVDKLELFKQVYILIFPDTTDKEYQTISNIITYLHNISLITSVKTNWGRILKAMRLFLKAGLSVLSIGP